MKKKIRTARAYAMALALAVTISISSCQTQDLVLLNNGPTYMLNHTSGF